jgi:hypothetical protein
MSGTPSPGATVTAVDSADFSSKLTAANCGDTIVLNAGTVYTGKFTLPAKVCDSAHWVTIRSSAIVDPNFPQEGVRATPCEINMASVAAYPTYPCATPGVRMPTVQTTATNQPVFDVTVGAKYYRFIGINFVKAPGVVVSNKLIQLTNGADHIIIDRSLCHGSTYSGVTTDDLQGCIGTSNSTYIAVIDSWMYDIYLTGGDAQGIAGGISNAVEGPIKVVNNLVAAAGESWLWGGGGATTTPHDLEIRRNHSFKPLSWFLPIAGSGTHPVVKNNGECKNCQRVILEANVFENSWTGWQGDQSGYELLLTPKNQSSNAAITVSIAGTNVTKVSGGSFTSDMVGHNLVIKDGTRSDLNSGYVIATFTDASHVALASSPTGGDGSSVPILGCHAGLCPTCFVSDAVVRYNEFRNTVNGMQVAAAPSDCKDEASGLNRVMVRDNLLHGLDNRLGNANSVPLGSVGVALMNGVLSTTVSDVTVAHNTVATVNAGLSSYSGLLTEHDQTDIAYLANMVYRDNVSPAGIIPLQHTGTGIPGGTLAGLNIHDCPNHDGLNCSFNVTKNILGIGQWNSQTTGCNGTCPAGYPAANALCGSGGETCFPSGTGFTGMFVNYNSGYKGDYHLQSSSPYRNAGTDGRNIGADVDTVIAKTAGVWAATSYPALSVTTATLPNGTVGTAYSQTLAASIGASPFKMWTLLSGALPSGLIPLDTDGTLSGTPTATGTFAFTVQVQDGGRQTATKALSITVQ